MLLSSEVSNVHRGSAAWLISVDTHILSYANLRFFPPPLADLFSSSLQSFFSLCLLHLSSSLPWAGDSVCRSPGITSCTDCLSRGPQCAWCFEEVGMRTNVCLCVSETNVAGIGQHSSDDTNQSFDPVHKCEYNMNVRARRPALWLMWVAPAARVNVSMHVFSGRKQRQSHFYIHVFSLHTLTHIAASAHASICLCVGLSRKEPTPKQTWGAVKLSGATPVTTHR